LPKKAFSPYIGFGLWSLLLVQDEHCNSVSEVIRFSYALDSFDVPY